MTNWATMQRAHARQPPREWQQVVRLMEIFHIAVNDAG